MKIVAVDASVDDAQSERALETALALSPARLFVFGAAARTAQRMAEAALAERDERFLDAAASWLLKGDGGAPPARRAVPLADRARALLEVTVAVVAAELPPLSTTARGIELVGANICMAVPNLAAVASEELDNAAVWLGGGAALPAVELGKGRAMLAPGDIQGTGGVLVVEVLPGELRIARLDGGGAVIESRSVPLAAGSRMHVRG